MSRNSQKNREARKRKQQRQGKADARTGSVRHPDTDELVYVGIEFAAGPAADEASLRRVVARLAELDTSPDRAALDGRLSRMIEATLDGLFASGWQPAEVVHAVRRDLGARPTRLLTTAIGYHAARTRAHTKAPEAWQQQLHELRLPAAQPTTALVTHWRYAEAADADTAWTAILQLLGYCSYLPPLDPLIPIPAQWGRVAAAPTDIRGADPRVLAKIRGLLAKAESTTFAAEAESLSEKAQDLMTRYAVDSAVVDAHEHASLTDQVRTRRLLIDNPYPEAKMQLLNSVADTNRVRVLWHQRHGIASCVGMPVDLDLCELLYTSLLVQASNALAEAGGQHRTKRAPSFRRAFLIGFAHRIGERLEGARERAGREAQTRYGKELVPIMAERTEAVGSVFERQFPEVVQVSQSVTNAHGWQAGRVAAELADITGGRERLTG